MALADMQSELRGSVPKLPYSFTKTLVNRAWRKVRESNLWSFNLFESSWVSPTPVQAGTVTATQGLATITFDATAVAALNASNATFSLITQRQFRIGVGGIYSIIAYNNVTGAATLDRIFGDPSAAGSTYQVYQNLYAPPMQDFLVWLSVRNPQMFLDLDLTRTRQWLDARDPQRSWYQFPTHVVPYGMDIRGAGTTTPSPTLNFPLFELWGQPVQLFTYQCYGLRRGADLALPTDTLPPAVGEDLVLAKAKEYAYEWAAANNADDKTDWKFLVGLAEAQYKQLIIQYRRQDKETINNWTTMRDPSIMSHAYGYYNTISSVAGPYTQY